MKTHNLKYPFDVRPLSEDDGGGYLITFPDLPGCMSDGESVDEAINNGLDAIECWLMVAKERGQKIPEPKTKYSGQFVQRIPKSTHARLTAVARSEGVSMNTLVAQYISEGLISAEIKTNFELFTNKLSNKTRSFEKSLESYRIIYQDKDYNFYKATDKGWDKIFITLEEALNIPEWNILLNQERMAQIKTNNQKLMNNIHIWEDGLISIFDPESKIKKKLKRGK